MNRLLSIALAALSLMLCACNADQVRMEKAEKLQRSILTLDTHTDTPMRLWREDYKIDMDNPTGCIDFPKMRKGSLDVESFGIFTWQGGRDTSFYNKAYKRGLATLALINGLPDKYPDQVGIVSVPDDMYRLKKEGRLGILPTIENLTLIGNDISRISELYDGGVRMFGLVHSYNNDISDSSSDTTGAEHGGLSPFGEEVVKELNRIGGIIDVSHASDSAFFDVVRLSKAPIVASHSSVRAVAEHDRNFSDRMLETLKENGGVIQICILADYVKNCPDNPEYDRRYAELRRAYRSLPADAKETRDSLMREMSALKDIYPDQKVLVSDYVDHIDYVVKKIGVDYVGIGTDFDGGGGIDDCKDASQLINITAEMIDRGYSKEDIEKIWGGNFIRVFREVQRLAETH